MLPSLYKFVRKAKPLRNMDMPWKHGNYVYATDSHIIVRFPASFYPLVLENPKAPDVSKRLHWDRLAKRKYQNLPADWLRADHTLCKICNGTGIHLCPECADQHTCHFCSGHGFTGETSVIKVGKQLISSYYAWLTKDLTGLSFSPGPAKRKPLALRFLISADNEPAPQICYGFLMPMIRDAS